MPETAKLKAVIEAEDKASKKIQDVGLSFGKMAGAVAVGQAAFAAFNKIVAIGTDFVKDSIKQGIEAETQMRRTNAILATLTGDMKENQKAVTDAGNAALKLGFDDEQASESMAKLMQVTQDTATAQKAMAVAMDLARFKGVDLESSAQAITMALNGNTRVLKQLGIEVPDNASKMEVLGLVMERTKGQAAAFAGGTEGSMMILNESINNIKESFGQALLKGLQPFIGQLSTWIADPKNQEFIAGVAEKVGILATQLGNLGLKIIPPVINWLEDLAQGWKELNDIVDETLEGFKAIGRFLSFSGSRGNFENPFSRAGDFLGKLLPGRAAGGPITGMTMVGEQGPELYVPSTAGQIISNRNMGGVTMNFTVNGANQDIRGLAMEIKRIFDRELATEQLGV